ncbi:MAG: HAD hydrolase-like protein [Lachnospiraceae bacterium]|nr:HAD hydrolase-like protein [Lachnospiraceae bacterium]
MKQYQYVCFDLDGTIVQSEFGIIKSARIALKKMGYDADKESDREMFKFIGPPLYNSFHDFYGMSEEEALEAVGHYRAYYGEKGLYDAPVYEGMEAVLKELHAQGKQLFVVTSKPGNMAEKIISHFGLDRYFTAIIGPDASERSPKKQELLERAITEHGIKDRQQVIMIGDRLYDIEGAKGAGVDSIGVLYGYGSLTELTEAGATYIAKTPQDLLPLL